MESTQTAAGPGEAGPRGGDGGRVLCVDLDGSLIAGDLLYESLMGLLRTRPLEALRIPGWLSQGRACLKRRLAERGGVDAAALPYHEDVIDYLRREKAAGRRLVLATASDEGPARLVADHLGLFDDVISSDGTNNLKGAEKLRAIEAKYGRGGFDYLGNGPEDLPIWRAAGAAVVARPGSKLLAAVRTVQPDARVFDRTGPKLSVWPKLLRVHQWVKNVLIFVPVLMGHRFHEPALILACLIAFFAFSFGASSIYIVNDLIDLPSDRAHPRKRRRPLAAGAVSIPAGIAASLVLLASSLALGLLLPPMFALILCLYLATSISYTFVLKKKLMVDVLCLAGLYTLRILAGGAATGIVISPWLMAFSMFLFLSLAFVKRYTELSGGAPQPQAERIPGRGYMAVDLDMIRSVGPASGYLAVLVVCLFLNDPLSVAPYPHPRRLWLICPVLLYWISRIWFLAQRGQMHSDPVVFAVSDRISLVSGLLCAAILIAANF